MTKASSRIDRDSRLLVDSIPGLVALLTPSGEVEFVNRQVIEYTGRTLEQLRHWGTDDTVHPEDLPDVIQAFRIVEPPASGRFDEENDTQADRGKKA